MNFNKILFLIAPFILTVLEPIVKYLQKHDGKIRLERWDVGWIPVEDSGYFDKDGFHKTGD